jgi:hypothetical protein
LKTNFYFDKPRGIPGIFQQETHHTPRRAPRRRGPVTFRIYIYVRMLLLVICALSLVLAANAFTPAGQRVRKMSLNEDFRLDKTTIVSDPLIFSEKQLRENLPEPEPRWNPFAGLLPDLSGIFAGDGVKKAESPPAVSSARSSLKSTVSFEVLESRTSDFVKGKIDAKKFSVTLKAAFGNKLSKVLPEILSNLPSDKAAALSKVIK